MRRRLVTGVLVALVLAVSSACSSGSSDAGSTSTAAASGSSVVSSGTSAGTTATRPLRILVTNDDGVGADGIDAVVEALAALPDTEVVVVAPVANQSGTGANLTDGPLTVTDATTASGYPAKAVDGFPADTIVWAIDQGGVDERPDLVISGINAGQNLGPTVEISGTVGAARAAGQRGIPALAASQGIGEPPDFPTGVDLVVDWVTEHRAELLALEPSGGPIAIANLNVPTCGTTGTMRGVVEVTTAADVADRDILVVDCASTATGPTDDIDAFIHGYAPLAELEVTP